MEGKVIGFRLKKGGRRPCRHCSQRYHTSSTRPLKLYTIYAPPNHPAEFSAMLQDQVRSAVPDSQIATLTCSLHCSACHEAEKFDISIYGKMDLAVLNISNPNLKK
jgi:hypothetical protein